MDLAAKNSVRHRTADQRGRDVVEKRGQHEHHHQQNEGTLPLARQVLRQHGRHLAVLEMLRQQREADKKAQQVGEDDPLVREMADQSRDAVAGLESGERKLVDGDRRQPDQRHAQRVVVEQRDTEQRQREQDEVDRDPQHFRRSAGSRSERERCNQRCRSDDGAAYPRARPLCAASPMIVHAFPPWQAQSCLSYANGLLTRSAGYGVARTRTASGDRVEHDDREDRRHPRCFPITPGIAAVAWPPCAARIVP